MRKFIIISLEKLINRYLTLDPETAPRLQKLDNKIITLELTGLNYLFQLIFSQSKVRLITTDFLPPDASIKGSPLSLLHASLSATNRRHLLTTELIIEGEAECAQLVIDLFDHLEIDWEEYASKWIGDIPAHKAGDSFQKVTQWGKRFKDALTLSLNDYLHEEALLFPPKEALQDFFNEVDRLRLSVDRVESKVQNLEDQINRYK